MLTFNQEKVGFSVIVKSSRVSDITFVSSSSKKCSSCALLLIIPSHTHTTKLLLC